MQKLVITTACLAMICAPQLASAQGAPPSQSSTTPIQQRVKSNLEQAGFKNVRVMPSSLLVRATDKDGNPVMMVINPDSITEITDVTGDQQRSGSQPTATPGSSTAPPIN